MFEKKNKKQPSPSLNQTGAKKPSQIPMFFPHVNITQQLFQV